MPSASFDPEDRWKPFTEIRDIRATPVRVPVKKIGHFSQARRTHIERTIVEVVAEDGTTGLGETRTAGAADIINQRFAPELVGQRLGDFALLRRRCLPGQLDFGYPEIFMLWNAFAAIDTALWDIRGKLARCPSTHFSAARSGLERGM